MYNFLHSIECDQDEGVGHIMAPKDEPVSRMSSVTC